jgi:hypothetical protein
MKGLVIPIEIAQSLLLYLDKRPHGEVRNFIDAISAAPQVVTQETSTPPPDVGNGAAVAPTPSAVAS